VKRVKWFLPESSDFSHKCLPASVALIMVGLCHFIYSLHERNHPGGSEGRRLSILGRWRHLNRYLHYRYILERKLSEHLRSVNA